MIETVEEPDRILRLMVRQETARLPKDSPERP